MNAVDTNIFVYAFTKGDPRRDAAVRLVDALPDDKTVLLWQVACETGAVLDRIQRENGTKKRTVDYPRLAVQLLMERFQLAFPGANIIGRGWDIHARYGVSYWDAMLISACVDAGVKVLYTEDTQSQPEIEGVKLINPFNA